MVESLFAFDEIIIMVTISMLTINTGIVIALTISVISILNKDFFSIMYNEKAA